TQLPSGLWVLNFDGDDYIEVPAAATQLNFTTSAFTILYWLNMANLASAPIVFIRGLFGTDGYYTEVRAGGEIRFSTHQAAGANQISSSGAGEIVTGSWCCVTVTRSGADAKIYKNGNDLGIVSATHIDPATSSRSAKIGIYDDLASNPFDDGTIGEVSIYNRALSFGEIRHLYQQTKWRYQ
ncbi:hypothetical protein LCGC14_2887740, partial [marine sediment metagenome]